MAYGLEPLITSVASQVFCKSQLEISHECIPNFDKVRKITANIKLYFQNKTF